MWMFKLVKFKMTMNTISAQLVVSMETKNWNYREKVAKQTNHLNMNKLRQYQTNLMNSMRISIPVRILSWTSQASRGKLSLMSMKVLISLMDKRVLVKTLHLKPTATFLTWGHVK